MEHGCGNFTWASLIGEQNVSKLWAAAFCAIVLKKPPLVRCGVFPPHRVSTLQFLTFWLFEVEAKQTAGISFSSLHLPPGGAVCSHTEDYCWQTGSPVKSPTALSHRQTGAAKFEMGMKSVCLFVTWYLWIHLWNVAPNYLWKICLFFVPQI